jgi:hypothetical protein
MATTVTNKTRKPLSVPLGQGKKLYLGPGKSGEIASNDAERPAVKALVESGSLEIGHARGQTSGGGGQTGGRPSQGYTPSGGGRRGGSGDR